MYAVSGTQEPTMSATSVIRVYEPALCCATGVCGTDLDQTLVQFTADLDFLKGQGVDIERYNLAVDPMAFASDETVRSFLQVAGSEGLPLTLVNGVTVATGTYLSRARLANLAGLEVDSDAAAEPDEDLCCTPEEAAATGCCSEAPIDASATRATGCCSSDAPIEASDANASGCCGGSTNRGHADLGLTSVSVSSSGCC
jgi:hypothetical protein